MGYYVRVLSKNSAIVSIDAIKSVIKQNGFNVRIDVDDESSVSWEQITVLHEDQIPICVIERNDVIEGSLGQDELEEFLDEIPDYKPQSSVKWLKKYLKDVKVIYAIQILRGIDIDDGWDIMGSIKEVIWSRLGGILQADSEGFSNEDGYHILWQFDDNVSGSWQMALLNMWGKWIKFKMDLSDESQRKEFMAGRVPKSAELIE